MTIKLTDKTHASLRYVNGQAVITYHAKDNKRIVLPVGCVPTIALLQTIYNGI